MATGIIGKDVLEAMLPLEGRANIGQGGVGTEGMGEAVGTSGHMLISAHCLHLQVRVWFQNRRVKYQKQQRLKPPAASAMAASPDEPSSSSDTITQTEDAKSVVGS